MKSKVLILLTITIISVFFACTGYQQSTRNRNVSFLYTPGVRINPEYIFYNRSDSVSTLFFSVPMNELLFVSDQSEQSVARVSVHYKLFSYSGNNQIVDSATLVYQVIRNDIQQNFINDIRVRARKGARYILEVNMTDLFRKTKNISFIDVDKTSSFTKQNFLVTDKNEIPVFKNHFVNGDSVFIRYSGKKAPLFVSKFNPENQLPAPPFSIKPSKFSNVRPDTTFEIEGNEVFKLYISSDLMYHVQADTNYNMGLTLYNFGTEFPNVNTPAEMFEAMRYITTRKEYDRLAMYQYKKDALDEFWLQCSGNINRARELIRIYYNRASYANQYFSSHCEGWKTDRGMIYIIYGPPSTVFKTNTTEQWVYGNDISIPSMNFQFNKMTTPFSDNNYILLRNETYTTGWYQAVETWRDGRAFSVSD